MSLPFHKKSIQQMWTEFQKQSVPPNAPAVQVTETRRAFYAGFVTLLMVNMRIGESDVSEADACAYLDQLLTEATAEMRKANEHAGF